MNLSEERSCDDKKNLVKALIPAFVSLVQCMSELNVYCCLLFL